MRGLGGLIRGKFYSISIYIISYYYYYILYTQVLVFIHSNFSSRVKVPLQLTVEVSCEYITCFVKTLLQVGIFNSIQSGFYFKNNYLPTLLRYERYVTSLIFCFQLILFLLLNLVLCIPTLVKHILYLLHIDTTIQNSPKGKKKVAYF